MPIGSDNILSWITEGKSESILRMHNILLQYVQYTILSDNNCHIN